MSEIRRTFASVLARIGRGAAARTIEVLNRGPHVEHLRGVDPNILYARGFLLCAHGRAPKVLAKWKVWDVGGRALHVDPRVPVDHATCGDREIWIVGDAFHPGRGVFKNMAAYVLDQKIPETLDGIAGRFLLVYRNGSKIEIYHDAMGARSVFHGEGVVASHAGLAADVLGSGLRDWIIPFITSRGYLQRDVKYLPGLDSPFMGVMQLTPNTRLALPEGRVERYWPRSDLSATDGDQALAALTAHLKGLGQYLCQNKLNPLIGLSAGRDSRGVFAALANLAPKLFTFVRSADGLSEDSVDSRTAKRLAEQVGLDLEIIKVPAPPHLDTAASSFAVTFRQNTGYVRGNNSGWVEHYHQSPLRGRVFIRGFGGEVMRGFYDIIDELSPSSLSNLYDLNAGSKFSQEAFAKFIEIADWSVFSSRNYKLSELFYWEHRMGIWGASALSESDMSFRSIPGYNSRDLFTTFMGLPDEIDRRDIFERAVTALLPELADVPYES